MEFTYTNESLIHEAIYSFAISLRNKNDSIDGVINAPRSILDAGEVVVLIIIIIMNNFSFTYFFLLFSLDTLSKSKPVEILYPSVTLWLVSMCN